MDRNWIKSYEILFNNHEEISRFIKSKIDVKSRFCGLNSSSDRKIFAEERKKEKELFSLRLFLERIEGSQLLDIIGIYKPIESHISPDFVLKLKNNESLGVEITEATTENFQKTRFNEQKKIAQGKRLPLKSKLELGDEPEKRCIKKGILPNIYKKLDKVHNYKIRNNYLVVYENTGEIACIDLELLEENMRNIDFPFSESDELPHFSNIAILAGGGVLMWNKNGLNIIPDQEGYIDDATEQAIEEELWKDTIL